MTDFRGKTVAGLVAVTLLASIPLSSAQANGGRQANAFALGVLGAAVVGTVAAMANQPAPVVVQAQPVYVPPPVVYAPPPVYVAPAPVYVAPAPVYYAAPPPVVYYGHGYYHRW
jgi:hypothetical protein